MRKFAAALVCAGALAGVVTGTAQASTCAQDLNSSRAFGNGGAASDQAVALAPRFGFAEAPGPPAWIAGTPGTISGSLIVDQLLKGAISAVGSKATGYALEKLGLGAPDYRAQLDTLTEELRVANARLNDLQRYVLDLKKSQSESAYSTLVGQALPIVNDVKYVHAEIEKLPLETPAGQKRLGRSILDYVCEHMLSQQTALNLRLVGTAPEADGLITSSSKATRDSVRYWTDAQTRSVDSVLTYYVDYEALLLQLRVEWWHAIGTSKAYVVAQIEDVKKYIETQEKLLKPGIARPYGFYDVGQHYFVDVKHPGLVWWPIRVRDVLKYYSEAHRAELEGFVKKDFTGNWNELGLQGFRQTWFKPASERTPFGSPRTFDVGKPGDTRGDGAYAHEGLYPWLPSNDAHLWYLPTFNQVQELISGWTGSPLAYLKANSKPSFGYSLGWYDWGKKSEGNEVIWTQAGDYPIGYRLVDLRNGATSGTFDVNSPASAVVIAVRPADPGGYWYN